MAPLLFREMKGASFSCASPASTAVCTSIDPRSVVRGTIIGRPSLDRHLSQRRAKPYSEKSRRSLDLIRTSTSTSTSTSSKDLRSPTDSARYLLDDASFFDLCRPEVLELKPLPSSTAKKHYDQFSPRLLKPMKENEASSTVVRQPATARAHYHRVWDQSLVPFELPKDYDHKVWNKSLVPFELPKDHDKAWEKSLVPLDLPKGDKSSKAVLRPSSSTRSHQDQVVVLRVSLHCKGCEGKVRKHISKMEGVTAFDIDFATKKVTVKGDITPLGVLNSVSKVKNAQFWPSQPQAPPRASASF